MLNIILTIVGVILLLIGIIMVYDARIITKKFFGFGDQNDAATGLKILGFLVAIIGAFLIYFNINQINF